MKVKRAKQTSLIPGEKMSWLELFNHFIPEIRIQSKDIKIDPNDPDSGRLIPFLSQRIALEQISAGLEVGQRFFTILKARQLGMCYDPSMRVLTEDLRWIPVKSIKVGDRLVSCDEMPVAREGKRNGERKLRHAVVEALNVVNEDAYRIVFEDGRELIATGPHRHLVKDRGGCVPEWRPTSWLRPGDFVRSVTMPWAPADYEDGWFAGLLDGEGSVRRKDRAGVEACISQVAGAVLDRARAYLTARGYTFREEIDRRKPGDASKLGNKPVHKLVLSRLNEIFRLIGQTRPSRFVNSPWWDGKSMPGKRTGVTWAKVVSVEVLGPREMIDIQTSTKTFICEGLVSHNSTVMLAIDLFWLIMHPGLQGALVCDSDDNREKFRLLFDNMIKSLPRYLRPKVLKNNRDMLVLQVGATSQDMSVLDYLVAGRKKGKNALGVGKAYNFIHGTEISRWGDPAGFDNLMASLSEVHPDRLYVFESTAHGWGNHFHDLWNDTKEDSFTRKAIFIGWWAKESYRIEKDDPRFKYYMHDVEIDQEELDAEREKTLIVSAKYGFRIEPEQIAWYRYYKRMRQGESGSMEENYPWHEEEAFVLTGNSYFNVKRIAADTKQIVGNPDAGVNGVQFKGYRYNLGENFIGTKENPSTFGIEAVRDIKEAELRVWEDPSDLGQYVIGVDPAYGRNDWKNNHCVEVFRCYADCLVQVAEYATHEQETYQIAWVLAHLAGCYRNNIINLEVTGPGGAIMLELKRVKQQLQSGLYNEEAKRLKLTNALDNARWYMYHRPDAPGIGYAWNWKTTNDNKHLIFNEMRDSHTLRRLIIKSKPLLDEMMVVVQDGDEIGAPGRKKDDRVFSTCLAHKAWVDKVRNQMIQESRTLENEIKREVERMKNLHMTFESHIILDFFRDQQNKRRDAARIARWGGPRLA